MTNYDDNTDTGFTPTSKHSEELFIAAEAFLTEAAIRLASVAVHEGLRGDDLAHLSLQVWADDEVRITMFVDTKHPGCDLDGFADEDDDDEDDPNFFAPNPYSEDAARNFLIALGLDPDSIPGDFAGVQIVVIDNEDQYADAQSDFERVFGGGVAPIALPAPRIPERY